MYKGIGLLLLLMAFCFADERLFTSDTLVSWLNHGSPIDFILIDLRGPSDNITKIIGTAKCKPYNLIWQDEFTQTCAKIDKSQNVVLYCKSGGRSSSAASYLQSLGYTHVYNAGGFSYWNGPTLNVTEEFLPDSILPAPSMRAASGILTQKNQIRVLHGSIVKPVVFLDDVMKRTTFNRLITVTGKNISRSSRCSNGIYLYQK